ncbi:hypothetical protein Athai_25080 [Actinocatenispora thailandica]|uniref:WXG100 family type VII secretion target n=1 Tax=Actinocatenispora thailandica TaxID=227318 RepID=A0A7R7DNI0_9ACTN|nr:type VII secretion target [Actinocatenispora thailandica]BCJ35005.1 hypothetical protein Athai_25080 [Actinocatenispora thailandica]
MSRMQIDTRAVRRYAPGLGDVASDLADALSTLQEALDADDGAWGDDKYGQAFLENYGKPAKSTPHSVGQVVHGIKQMRRNLVTAADNYDQTEDANTFTT